MNSPKIYTEADNKTYIHRDSLPPCQKGRFRADIELINPAGRNPHSLGGYNAHTCFYSCDDWVAPFGIHSVTHPNGSESYRFFIESAYPYSLDLWDNHER